MMAGGAGFLTHNAQLLATSNNPTYLKTIPKIQTILLKLEGKGQPQSSIKHTRKLLTSLAQRADLENATETELAIARYIKQNRKPCTNNYKNHLCIAYQKYCKQFNLTWERPHYIKQPASIQPPTNARIEAMITAAHGTLSIKLEISYRTGLRPCEVVGQMGLRTKDIHTDQNTITPRSAKGCNARPALKIPESLTARLQTYIHKKQLQPNDTLFAGTPERYGEHFIRLKHCLATKMNDTQFLTIRLYDLRHAYITNLLRRTQNAEIVRQIVGHKRARAN